MSDETIKTFKELLVLADYVARFNHYGALMIPGHKHYRQDGAEHTWNDVLFFRILEEVENRIGKLTERSVDQRLHMLDQVMRGIKRGPNPKTPKWALAPLDPNKEPVTPWSTSKAVLLPPIFGFCHSATVS